MAGAGCPGVVKAFGSAFEPVAVQIEHFGIDGKALVHDLAGAEQWRQLGVDNGVIVARLVRERATLLTSRQQQQP